MFDVDVAVLSAIRPAAAAVEFPTIGTAILIALAANALGRLSLAILAGPVRFWAPLLVTTVAAAVVGIAAFSFSSSF